MPADRPIHMTRLILAVLVVFTLLVAACGDGDSVTSGAAELDGRQFIAVTVEEGGAARPLVDGTRIDVRFDDGNIGLSAGCNSMGATYRIDDGVLIVDDMAMTAMGCDPARHAQDDFLASFVADGPEVVLEGDRLRLIATDVVIELDDRRLVEPDHPIVGTTWEVTGFIDGETATSFAVGTPGRLVFDGESTLVGFDGCAEFTMNVELSDGSIGGPVEGDAEVQFGSAQWAAEDCEAAEYRDEIREVLVGAAVITVDGPNLVIVNNDALGLNLRAN